ncbi:valine--tRNA ligase [Hyphobacterium sp. CCMP332]|nr:valine--tRNA ligase [Hyphobacterium sp. CCMP332]
MAEELSTKYNPVAVEDKWYSHWMKNGFFKSSPDPSRKPYTIVIPPPNVTGVLHMGHMLNNTIQDVLIRRARMKGFEALWVPGTDHASIATEAKVVAMLKEKGLSKKEIGREKFLEHAWEWKEKYGGIILEQLKKLGASCDWDRTRFTMEESLSEAVIYVFVDLYEKGMIYRGIRMVNWDPEGKTAISDDEVVYKDVNSRLYFVNYKIEGEDREVTIATTRPETILGDTAVCINPNDERYKDLKGKKVIVPIANRLVPIIEDEYVSMEFGTGCLKVTPAHDINDYELGQKHQLESIEIFNDDGTLNKYGLHYENEDRFVVRKKIAKELESLGQMAKIEEYQNSVGFSERTDAVIEPKLSMQWFLKMDEITKPAYENVMNDTIKLIPPKFKNMYRHWMENVRDWCISRQLWWGHRIPAWYINGSDFVIAKNEDEALRKAKQKTGNEKLQKEDLKQDEDVLDTWFSSWLWPISVFDGFKNPDNKDINYYYPTNTLVTAPEILFFWVARMIIAGYEYKGERPFNEVYLTGIVRDKQGRKMSKSLGNSPDPLELIAKYGADGVRVGMLLSSPAGNDLLFDIKLCEQGRNFNNKIWNAFRLVRGWEVDEKKRPENEIAIEWFENRFRDSLQVLEDHFSKYRMSDALMTVYKLVWDDFCSWYLEMVKPPYQQAIDAHTYNATLQFFDKLVRVLHPFTPFISEEIWSKLRDRDEKDCLIVAEWPETHSYDEQIIDQANRIFEVVSAIRNFRNEKQISPKIVLNLNIETADIQVYQRFESVLKKLANIDALEFNQEAGSGDFALIVRKDKLHIPMDQSIDVEEEQKKLKEELEYTKGFLASVSKKLSNERFVNNAPEAVVAKEKQKQQDAEERIKVLEKQLESLS